MVHATQSNTQTAQRSASFGGWRCNATWPWRSRARLASFALVLEQFLLRAGSTLAPWLAAGMAGGVAAWFALFGPLQWILLIAICFSVALFAGVLLGPKGRWPCLAKAMMSMALAVALGCGLVWAKSTLVGTPAIPAPMVLNIRAIVVERQELPAQSRICLILGLRLPGEKRAIKARITLKTGDPLRGGGGGLCANAGEACSTCATAFAGRL
jgi:competence protein ComEC